MVAGFVQKQLYIAVLGQLAKYGKDFTDILSVNRSVTAFASCIQHLESCARFLDTF
jgi:hypothetical protein